MNWGVIILLILFGLIALILEVLVIPGGIVGILGIMSIVGGVIVSYLAYGSLAGNITLGVTSVVVIGALILTIRSKTWRKLMLNTQIDSKMNLYDTNKIKVGAIGKSLSRITPTGKADFDGETIEVSSWQEFINENQEIIIIKIDGNKIIVKPNK